jgi:predicted transcriptional regulator
VAAHASLPPTMGTCDRGLEDWSVLGTAVVPLAMAMNLRLSDAESEALRSRAEQEGRSMQEVARTAIAQYVSDRPQRLLSAIQRVRTEDRELLERLSK